MTATQAETSVRANPPPMLLGATLIFWGWQTGLLNLAVPMGCIFEAARIVRLRWDFSNRDFNRISDLCALIFFGMTAYHFMLNRSVYIIFTLLEWLPLAFFPMVFAQNYSVEEAIDIRTVSLLLRRQGDIPSEAPPLKVSLNYPYFAAVIVCASFANIRDDRFYVGMILLSAWAFFMVRGKRHSVVAWGLLLLVATGGGYAGHVGLNRLQAYLEVLGAQWFFNLERADSDPYESMTAIGRIGALKPSNRVLFRVRMPEETATPLLLREAAYNVFGLNRWLAREADFEEVLPGAENKTWTFGERISGAKYAEVSDYLEDGQGMLKLPSGFFRIENLQVFLMKKNRMGAVKVAEGPGLATYTIRYGGMGRWGAPDSLDLEFPVRETEAVGEIVHALGLRELPPEKGLERLGAWFDAEFSYSLNLEMQNRPTPLADFLRRVRSGHCEYFATATVLILRAAGIPARYVTGFSVHEYSPLEDAYVVRTRHAHAWAEAYVNGAWREADFTSSDWRGQEAEAAASWWQAVTDLWDWISYQFSLWRWSRGSSETAGAWLMLLILPLIIIIGRRLYQKKRFFRPGKKRRTGTVSEKPGASAPFRRIETRLHRMGFERGRGESARQWVRRIEDSRTETPIPPLEHILALHYRYRFDPNGLHPLEFQQMEAKVDAWLRKLEKQMVG